MTAGFLLSQQRICVIINQILLGRRWHNILRDRLCRQCHDESSRQMSFSHDWFSGRAAKLTKTICDDDDDDGDDDLIIKTCRCLAIWFSGQGSRPRKAFRYFSLPHLDDLELQSVPQSSPPPLNRESYRSHLLYVPRFQSMYCDGTWSNYKRSGVWVDPPPTPC